jgi:hypothetical protein
MDSSLKNVTTILVILTCAFLGYYVFMQKGTTELALDGSAVTKDLFVDVQKYIERRNVLDKVTMDTSVFNEERFRSLKGYPTDVPTQPKGRVNPFDTASPSVQE